LEHDETAIKLRSDMMNTTGNYEITIDGVEYTLTPKVPVEPTVVQRWIDIEVYPEDAPKAMSWNDAVAWCRSLGNGWRLPDRQELLMLYEQRYLIGGFGSYCYWSSSEGSSGYAWEQSFGSGGQSYNDKSNAARVRAVRSREAGK
jgi:hypothetical protein